MNYTPSDDGFRGRIIFQDNSVHIVAEHLPMTAKTLAWLARAKKALGPLPEGGIAVPQSPSGAHPARIIPFSPKG